MYHFDCCELVTWADIRSAPRAHLRYDTAGVQSKGDYQGSLVMQGYSVLSRTLINRARDTRVHTVANGERYRAIAILERESSSPGVAARPPVALHFEDNATPLLPIIYLVGKVGSHGGHGYV